MADDEHTWKVARSLVDHALDWGWDEEHGGFYDKGESFAGSAFDRNKVWWTEAEGLNALMVMHKKYGDQTDRYARAFRKQWDFIRKSPARPDPRRLVLGDDPRGQADRRRREGQRVEGQLPHLACPDERGHALQAA